MKLVQVSTLFLCVLLFSGCPRPVMPTFCDAPDRITVDNVCYKDNEGLIVRASRLAMADLTIRFEWTVFIFADSSNSQYFDHADITISNGPRQITVPDTLLKDNQKIYVRVNTYCSENEKAPGVRYNQFVKRYKKSNACYKWEEQPF